MDKPTLSVSIKDCQVEHFRSGGPGGQNQNKRDTGTRIRHAPSGAVAESREHRTQRENTIAAWNRLIYDSHFRVWLFSKSMEIVDGRTLAEKVEDKLAEENLKIEVRNKTGRWTTEAFEW